MVKFETVSYPSCRHERNMLHSIRVYETMPLVATDDGDLVIGVALCDRQGIFVWKTTTGWQRQERGSAGVYLGDSDEMDDEAKK